MEVILVIMPKLRTLCSVFSSRDVFHKTNITTIISSKTFVIIKVLHNQGHDWWSTEFTKFCFVLFVFFTWKHIDVYVNNIYYKIGSNYSWNLSTILFCSLRILLWLSFKQKSNTKFHNSTLSLILLLNEITSAAYHNSNVNKRNFEHCKLSGKLMKK